VNVVRSPDGIPIAFETRGAGRPALVFVHGWSCDRTYWRSQVAAFATRFEVVAVDLAGHGDSGAGRTAWTMAAFGGDVAAVVEARGLDRVVLIGHSMGGDVIVEAARRLSGRVAGLIWVDTYRQLRDFRTSEEVQALMAPFRVGFVDATREFVRGMFPADADPVLVEQVATDMSAAPEDVALGAMAHSFSFGPQIPGALEELNLPAAAINTDIAPTDVESLQRFGIRVEVVPGVGHFPMMEAPDRFNAVLATVVADFTAAPKLLSS
jgi:pimeloyl-ACP methyl ester carboxylesterase